MALDVGALSRITGESLGINHKSLGYRSTMSNNLAIGTHDDQIGVPVALGVQC